MSQTPPTDINSRRRKGGAKDKSDALKKLGDKGEQDGFDAGPENPNIRQEDEKPKRRTHRAKQEQLIDVAPIVPPIVKMAAERYLDKLGQRMDLTREETEARSELIDAMVKTQTTSCSVNGRAVNLKQLYKIETKTEKEDE